MLLLSVALVLAACGGRGSSTAIPGSTAQMPSSLSPAAFTVAPMVRTPVQPSAIMASRRPQSTIQMLGWTQLSGGAVLVAASPDGSLWALSSIGTGPDRSIWHYVNGTWTNIPGAAMRLSVAPNGTLWAVNSAGGIYAYNGSWTGIAGGATDITVASDGTVYVISNQGGGTFGRDIWRYSGGAWSRMPGAAVRIVASWDPGTYSGPLDPGGFYAINADTLVYYYSLRAGFNLTSFHVAELAPTQSGGRFELGGTANPDGSYPIVYTDLSNPNPATRFGTLEPGAATTISSDGTSVYVTGAAGGIYKAAVVAR